MDTKTLVKALKMAVREVIKEELTEILREGLQSTITEMSQPKKIKSTQTYSSVPAAKRKPSVQFNENRWAAVLNQTDALIEQGPSAMNSFSELMNEDVDTMQFDSTDARGFGQMRQSMKTGIHAPATMEDPETGKVYDVDPTVAAALTRDYSALMKAIDKKKG
jgi:hypothetical protein